MTDFLQLRSLKTVSVADKGSAYLVLAQGTGQLTSYPSCVVGRLYSHGTQEQSYQDTPSHGKPVRIMTQHRRYRCTSCGKTCLESIADLDGKRQATSRLIKFVQDRCQRETFSALACQVGLDEKTIRHVFQDFVEALQATRSGAEAACERWKANISPEMNPVFKELSTAVRNWHEEIFTYFEKPITNAYTESINRLAKDMNRMGRGYSFDVIRARMLYADKALKDAAQIETIYVDEGSSGAYESVMASSSRANRRKKAQRVVLYGSYIPTLCEMLEAGHFE